MWRQAFYRAAVDTALDAIVVIDAAGIIQSANAAVERVFGYRPQELTGRNVSLLMPAEHAGHHDGYIARYRQTGDRRVIGSSRSLFGRRKDGALVPVEASVAEWTADDGCVFFTGIMRDVSERNAAEVALRDSQEWLRTVSDTALVGLLVVDQEHRIGFANRAFSVLYDLSPRDLAGRPLAEVLPETYRAEMRDRLDATFQGSRHSYQSVRQASDDPDRCRHLTSTFDLSRNASGALVAVVVVTDVTELKRSEEDLGASRDLLQSVLDGTLDPIFAKDRCGRYVAVNDSAAAILGCRREGVIGRDDQALDTSGMAEALMTQDRRIMDTGHPEVFEYSTPAADGGTTHYVVTKRPWAGPDGTVRGTVGIAHDVTEQRLAAAERREVAKRLHAAQEQERLRIARDLHDQVGQDLTALALGLQALAAEVAPAGQDRLSWLRGLADQIGRDLHRTALQLRSTTLDDLGLKAAITSHVTDLGARLDLQADLYLDDIDACDLEIDAQLALFRAVQECLTNVLKHADAMAVSVTARYDGSWLRIAVEDDGRGFDPEAGCEGMPDRGLGLLGIRERLAAVGGTLTIESSPGRGTGIFLALRAQRRCPG